MRNTSERTLPASRVQKGLRLLNEHRALLQEVGTKYGVPPGVIVALWGMETDFGRATGNFPVLASLATLAYDGRRSALFRRELLEALKIVDAGHVRSESMTGSWAGAMGQNQFMPSSFMQYAVDYDGDGRRDIWTTVADVFASTANYLASSGWHRREPWGHRVVVPATFDVATNAGQSGKALGDWQVLGVRRADGGVFPAEIASAVLVLPSGAAIPAFLVYANYQVFLKWNRSQYFAPQWASLRISLRGSNDLLGLKSRSFQEPASRIEGTMQPGTTSLRYIQAQCSNVPCAIEIGITMPAACRIGTGKAFACPLPEMQADMAHLRRIGRRNEMHHDPSVFSLVRHELPQLEEGPTIAAPAFRLLPGLLVGALADAGQVFQGEGTTGAEGIANQVFADFVVGLALKAVFTPRQPCQKLPTSAPATSGAFRGFLLYARPYTAVPITDGGQVLSTPVLIIAGVGNVRASQVHAQDISAVSARWRLACDLDMHVVGTIAAFDQRGTGGLLTFQAALLVRTKDGRKAFSTTQERQADGPVPCPKAEDTLIIVNGGGLERRVRFALDLERGTDTGNGTNSEIGRQTEACPYLAVTGMLHLHLIGGVLAPGHVGNVVAGIRKGDKRRIEVDDLLWCWGQFTGHGSYSLHTESVSHMILTFYALAEARKSVSSTAAEAAWLPRPEGQVL